MVDEFALRGFTTEVRQFANEMVATAQIWGLQLPFVVGKAAQFWALHMEVQFNSLFSLLKVELYLSRKVSEQKSKNISGSNEAMAAGGDNFGGRTQSRFSVRS